MKLRIYDSPVFIDQTLLNLGVATSLDVISQY